LVKPNCGSKLGKWIKMGAMPDEKKAADVERLLSEEEALGDRKQALLDDLLKQREAAMAAFDDKLAKLGYHANSGRSKRKLPQKGRAAFCGGRGKIERRTEGIARDASNWDLHSLPSTCVSRRLPPPHYEVRPVGPVPDGRAMTACPNGSST
jgi:hypothetical protein